VVVMVRYPGSSLSPEFSGMRTPVRSRMPRIHHGTYQLQRKRFGRISLDTLQTYDRLRLEQERSQMIHRCKCLISKGCKSKLRRADDKSRLRMTHLVSKNHSPGDFSPRRT